ncbi:efflux RND transporter periplasmic adaptor subunit [candidate division KSB1 bacterium]|nr:MAG: efflux RND transporter periplasmic adaptor subunit [candidate division KSB1 bacterium]
MKRFKKRHFVWLSIIIIIGIIFVSVVIKNKDKNNEQRNIVKVKIDTITEKALAVGSIEPVNEVAVKSKMSGVVGKLYVNVGDYVKAGEPLLEVKPNPTPLELVQAKRNIEMKKISLGALKNELERKRELKQKNLISDYEFESMEKDYNEALLDYKIASEQLELLEKGKVTLYKKSIDSIIKSPISGYILEKKVNLGDPVVPLTSYQAGTELMRMADMTKLIFKGTVDEIDVGKIKEGMRAELQIGALPGKNVIGHVSLISLKARKDANSTVFPVEIVIDSTNGAMLRAGFSANATIIIARKQNILTLPERVVYFRNDSAFVRIPKNTDGFEEKYIETGLSDAILIEVKSGLEKDQEVLEKETKEIL